MSEKKKDENIEINFGAGKISFGGIFKGLGSLIDLAARLNEQGEQQGEIKGLPKDIRGVYGISVRTLGGKAVVDSFGNIRDTRKGPVVEEVREPIIDIFDEKDRIRVIAELPGVSEKEINAEIQGDIVRITASEGGHKYAKEVLLPDRVVASSLRQTYKNGILELIFDKEK